VDCSVETCGLSRRKTRNEEKVWEVSGSLSTGEEDGEEIEKLYFRDRKNFCQEFSFLEIEWNEWNVYIYLDTFMSGMCESVFVFKVETCI